MPDVARRSGDSVKNHSMDSAGDRFVWGTETVRRSDGVPFLVYEPRRRNAAELLEDARHWGERSTCCGAGSG